MGKAVTSTIEPALSDLNNGFNNKTLTAGWSYVLPADTKLKDLTLDSDGLALIKLNYKIAGKTILLDSTKASDAIEQDSALYLSEINGIKFENKNLTGSMTEGYEIILTEKRSANIETSPDLIIPGTRRVPEDNEAMKALFAKRLDPVITVSPEELSSCTEKTGSGFTLKAGELIADGLLTYKADALSSDTLSQSLKVTVIEAREVTSSDFSLLQLTTPNLFYKTLEDGNAKLALRVSDNKLIDIDDLAFTLRDKAGTENYKVNGTVTSPEDILCLYVGLDPSKTWTEAGIKTAAGAAGRKLTMEVSSKVALFEPVELTLNLKAGYKAPSYKLSSNTGTVYLSSSIRSTGLSSRLTTKLSSNLEAEPIEGASVKLLVNGEDKSSDTEWDLDYTPETA